MTGNSRYMDGTLFLKDVTEKLRQRLDDIKQSLDEGQREIENMHEYYWETIRRWTSTAMRIMTISRLSLIR